MSTYKTTLQKLAASTQLSIEASPSALSKPVSSIQLSTRGSPSTLSKPGSVVNYRWGNKMVSGRWFPPSVLLLEPIASQ
jgi:hypothetical protein